MTFIPDRLIDLHSHTNESDGSLAPEELIRLAVETRLAALAITDHDTFEGYSMASPFAQAAGLELIRGIELNSRLELDGRVRWAHILAYFPFGEPAPVFLDWLEDQRDDRRNRNRILAERLQSQGIEVRLEEVEARGKSLAGRPHFARVLVDKGYATDADDAFRRYIGEDAPTFVERQSLRTEEVIGLILEGGGVPVIAHPIRLSLPHGNHERQVFEYLKRSGLLGLEVIHSDQSAALQRYYADLANDLGLIGTGGSDFHGTPKPDVRLGTGRDNVQVPYAFLEDLRGALRRA